MSKERIFELIRKEEIVLFSGAGMSLYAGYPSGRKLAEIFYENLTTDIKDEITFTSDLPKLTQDIYNCKGGNKNYLIEILKKELSIEPLSTETHELLEKIPQIKTIITTNYDTLFESTNKNLEVIRRSSDYPIADSKKQSLFKIHGDLTDTNNIILMNSDYNNYFAQNKEQTIFWNAVKDKLAVNHILFVGYTLEDPNVSVLLEKIIEELGDNRKEIFFISPSITQSKLKFLQRNGICYIETTGEELVKEIYEDLKFNYLPGLSKGYGTADTALKFANINHLDIHINKVDDNIIINNVKSLTGQNHNEVKFKIQGNEEKVQKALDSLRGKNFEDVNLEGDILKEYSHFINGVRISNQENIVNFSVKKVPLVYGIFDFIFEDGFELENYNMEIFIASPKKGETHLKFVFKDFTIILKINFNFYSTNSKFNIEIIPHNSISSTKSGLNFYNILSRITNNIKFKIYKDNNLFYTYDNKVDFKEDPLDATFLLNYFEKLKKIEQYFKERFTDINLDHSNKKIINYINSYIDKICLSEKISEFSFNIDNEDELKHVIENSEKEKVIVMSEKNVSTFELHGLKFNIGYLHKFMMDAFVSNKKALISDKTKTIKIKSKTNTMYYKFSDNASIIIKNNIY